MCDFNHMLLFVSKMTDLLQVFNGSASHFWSAFNKAKELGLLHVHQQSVGYAIYLNPNFFCAGGKEGRYYQKLSRVYSCVVNNIAPCHPLKGRRYLNAPRVQDYIEQQKINAEAFRNENEEPEEYPEPVEKKPATNLADRDDENGKFDFSKGKRSIE
jgi:hypothetical protein